MPTTADPQGPPALDSTLSALSAPQPPFAHILGQPAAVAALQHMLKRGKLPSALLFIGPPHVGKRSTALALARALNCTLAPGEGACGACPVCRKIDKGMHPDVVLLAPEGQFIKIDSLRKVIHGLALAPVEARKRVILLSRAERMQPVVANALLKTLEEPPLNTLLVLCAASRFSLPETIVSRCLPLRFVPLGQVVLCQLLGAELPEAMLDFAIRFARGQLRPQLCEQVPRLLRIREQVLEAWEGDAAFMRIFAHNAAWCATEDWRLVLEWLETWFRDVALLGSGVEPAHLINGDLEAFLRQWAQRCPPAKAWACYDRVQSAWRGAERHVNKQLNLEALWLACLDLLSP